MMQDKCKDKFGEATTVFVSYSFVYPWSRPINWPRSHNAYKSGMLSGNVEYALWCKSVQFTLFAWGRPFEEVMLTFCPDLASQCDELKQENHGISTRMYWQVMLNLSGRSRNTVEIKGEVFDPKINGSIPRVYIMYMELLLRVIFGEWALALEKALEMGDKFERECPSHQEGMLVVFLRGLAFYKAARRHRKYRGYAKKAHAKIQGWVQNGNPNVRHFCFFLDAESAALSGNSRNASTLYNESISLAARTGMLHMAALTNECFAELLRKDLKEDDARYRIEEALRFYKLWGAHGKVNALMKANVKSEMRARDF